MKVYNIYIYYTIKDGEITSGFLHLFLVTAVKPKSILSIYNHKAYLPIGCAVARVKEWQRQGAEIVYCTSRRGKQAEDIAALLTEFGFCGTRQYYRDKNQKYKDIIETVKPFYLIEDNCKSIGGSWQMCITYVKPDIKNFIHSIVVKEFSGIDEVVIDL